MCVKCKGWKTFRCAAWIVACNRADLQKFVESTGGSMYTSTFRVCNMHFEESMFSGKKSTVLLKKDAIPTLYLDEACCSRSQVDVQTFSASETGNSLALFLERFQIDCSVLCMKSGCKHLRAVCSVRRGWKYRKSVCCGHYTHKIVSNWFPTIQSY